LVSTGSPVTGRLIAKLDQEDQCEEVRVILMPGGTLLLCQGLEGSVIEQMIDIRPEQLRDLENVLRAVNNPNK